MTFYRRYRTAILIAGVVVLVLLWYAFRPEKLFINQRVNEAAPISDTDAPTLVSTTKLNAGLHATSGRASIYRSKDGSLELRLTNFMTSNGPDVHVVLTTSTDPALTAKTPGAMLQAPVELGALKGNQGDQNYALPVATDLTRENEVVIYCERFHAVFGAGTLESF